MPANKANINTDDEKVYAVLTNLVNNAIKFTKKGSVEFGYSLKTARSKTEVKQREHVELEFFVKDTGIGILPERLGIIFERFRQSNESLNKKYEGAGLGLSISKAFVEWLGGQIWIESEFGKGTTIYFSIPYNTCHKNTTPKID